MLAKILTILMLLLIVGSLFSALYRLSRRGDSDTTAVVKALTLRVALSVGLFLALLIGFQSGLISPLGLR